METREGSWFSKIEGREFEVPKRNQEVRRWERKMERRRQKKNQRSVSAWGSWWSQVTWLRQRNLKIYSTFNFKFSALLHPPKLSFPLSTQISLVLLLKRDWGRVWVWILSEKQEHLQCHRTHVLGVVGGLSWQLGFTYYCLLSASNLTSPAGPETFF